MRRFILPGPVPTAADEAYWSACRKHELRLLHCQACGNWHHPPLPLCPFCQKPELHWCPVEGPALLYSWTRVHVAMHRSVSNTLPYCVAVVEFPQCRGARLIAYYEHSGNAPPAIGSECEVFWITGIGGQPVPAFRKAPSDGLL